MNKQALIVASTAVASLAVGGFGGYLLAKKRVTDALNLAYNTRMEEEIEQTRKYYMQMADKPDPESFVAEKYGTTFSNDDDTVRRVAAGLAKSLQNQKLSSDYKAAVLPDVVKTAFDGDFDLDQRNAGDDEDWDIRAAREEALILDNVEEPNVPEFDAPYVISADVFRENEYERTQVTWTFFDLDSTLVDEQRDIVDSVEEFVGNDNLNRFGTGGSKDKNIVYIRNNRLDMDFEIIRHREAFSQQDDYKPRKKKTKFRQDADD